MRLILLVALASGCVTAGQVHDARVAQVNCLDDKIEQLRLSQLFGEQLDETESIATGCRAHDDGSLTGACKTIESEAQHLKDQRDAADRRAAESDMRCRALAANADALQAKREDQADIAAAALAGAQAAGRARQDMAATQADAPRPVRCTSNQSGAQTYTTCQ